MNRTDLSEYPAGELVWELMHRDGVAAMEAGEGAELAFRTNGPALALVITGMSGCLHPGT